MAPKKKPELSNDEPVDLRTALAQRYGKKISLNNCEDLAPLDRYMCGIPTIDIAFGGGFPAGRIVEISGPPSHGKGATYLMACKYFSKCGLKPLLIDLESTTEAAQLDAIGLTDDDLVIAFIDYGEMVLEVALQAMREGSKIVIIDSLPNIQPQDIVEKTEKDSGYRSVAGTAGLLARNERKIIATLRETQSCLVYINQVRDNINSAHGGKHTPGGNSKNHTLSIHAQFTHTQPVRKGDEIIPGSITTHFKMVKDKTAGNQFLTETMQVDYGVIDIGKSMVDCLAKVGLVKTSGSWLTLDESFCKELGIEVVKYQGGARLGAFLMEQPELFNQLYLELFKRNEINTNLIINLNGKQISDEEV